MANSYRLLETNPKLELKDTVYQDSDDFIRDAKIDNSLQIALRDIFDKAHDKSLFSANLEELAQTKELSNELSTLRHNYLRCLDLDRVNTALDLSQDTGGVAHYLASHVASVDSIKIDIDRARLAVVRCASKSNIVHVSSDLDAIKLPTQYYDLIVIGDLENLDIEQDRLTDLLARLRNSLSDRGALVLNAANPDRLNRWFDGKSARDDKKIHFVDLYNKQAADQALSRKTLRDSLSKAGYAKTEIHSIFSSGHSCKAIFSEEYLGTNPNSVNHFHRLGFVENQTINEYLLFAQLVDQKENLNQYASRYIAISGASITSLRQLYDNDFSHFAGTSRRPAWRTLTYRKRASQEVHKVAAFENAQESSSLIKQNLGSQPFHKGRLLVHDWLKAIVDLDPSQFKTCVVEYQNWLNSQAQDGNFADFGYDMLPFNLVVKESRGKRELCIIDPEWSLKKEISSDFVLFRALFWFAHENRNIIQTYCQEFDFYSIGSFVIEYMPNAHSLDDLADYVKLEEQLQKEINLNSMPRTVANAVVQSLNENRPVLEISWANQDGQAPRLLAHSHVWNTQIGEQTLSIQVAPLEESHPNLRIDPMAQIGGLKISQLKIVDKDTKQTIWVAEDQNDLQTKVTMVGMLATNDALICVDEDPHLLIDVADLDLKAKQLEVQISLIARDTRGLEESISILSQEPSKHLAALSSQRNRNNEYRAQIDYLNQRIKDLHDHREDLVLEVNNLKTVRKDKENQIDLLVSRLSLQYKLNESLYEFLTDRPSTRVKSFARRLMNRIRKRPPVELPSTEEFLLQTPKAENFKVPELVRKYPLPKGDLLGQNNEDYGQWVAENTLSEHDKETIKADIESMVDKPLFSILVPIYNTDPEYLMPMIESVRAQLYPHWELCLVDDCSPKSYLRQILTHEALQDERIKVQLNDVNQGISVTTNDALAMASGDYIALLDHDDEISIDALYENAKVINEKPGVGLIYSDEDKMDMQGNRLEPFFKPDYSPDFLSTNNYICHFSVINKSLIDELGGFREGLDGSQDHDVILRAAHNSEHVVHIPKILYHWRKIPGSTAVVYDAKSYAWEAGRKAIEDQLTKNEDGVKVDFGSLKGTYRVNREIKGEPLVSIVIPFKDKPELLDSCLNSILKLSSYKNFEIIGVSNNSEEQETYSKMQAFSESDARIRFVQHNIPFNFSAVCNYGVKQTKGEYVLLLNNDIEILTVDWIEGLLEHAQRPEVGAVGSKLLYPDGRIQHAGIVVGMVGAAGHPHKFFPNDHIGYHGRLHMVHNVSAVTGALLMVSKAKFDQVAGLDEDNLAVAYNDVDFCLKLHQQGYYNVFTPYVEATHHESISRGYEDTDEKMQRLLKEQAHFLEQWKDFIENGDPYYNPNLSLKNEYFSLNFRD